MKKKIFLIAALCLCILGMAACGKTDPTTVDYNGYSYDELLSTCQGTVQTLVSMTEEDKAYYAENGTGAVVNLINRWDELTAEYGAFVEFGEFNITKANKTLTAEQTIQLADREVILTYVYKYYNMEVQDITVDAVYSLGEKMSKAAINTVMCMLIVFAVLILISLIIYAFSFLQRFEQKKASAEAENKTSVATTVVESETVQQDDTELVAVIAAAIAAAEGTSTDGFVVRSIKRR